MGELLCSCVSLELKGQERTGGEHFNLEPVLWIPQGARNFITSSSVCSWVLLGCSQILVWWAWTHEKLKIFIVSGVFLAAQDTLSHSFPSPSILLLTSLSSGLSCPLYTVCLHAGAVVFAVQVFKEELPLKLMRRLNRRQSSPFMD